ncbi:hypothetical protein AYI69_g5262, partial [Smittium culicis]
MEWSLMEKLDTFITSKKPEKRSKIPKSFCGRQQISAQNGTYSKISQALTAEAVQISVTSGLIRLVDRIPSWGPPRNGSICVDQTGNRTNESQNGNADVDMQNFLEEGFHDLTGPRRFIYAYPDTQDAQEVSLILVERVILPVPCAPDWNFTKPPHFHQGPTTSSDLSSITGYAILGVPRRPTDLEESKEALELFNAGKITLNGLASFIGKFQPISVALLPGRLMLRRPQELKNTTLKSYQTFTTLNAMFGPHDVDLFASNKNKKLKAKSLLQLAPGYQDSRNKLAVGQLEWVEEPIRFPEMEFNLASASESQTGTTDSNSEFSSMEISDMVPRPYEFINFPTASVSSENSNNLPQKRKIASNRQQALDSND